MSAKLETFSRYRILLLSDYDVERRTQLLAEKYPVTVKTLLKHTGPVRKWPEHLQKDFEKHTGMVRVFGWIEAKNEKDK